MRPAILIAIILILLTLGAAGAHLQTTTTDLSRFNPGWSGTAAFYSLAGSMDAEILTPGTNEPDPADRYIIIAPKDASPSGIAEQVLQNGGSVIIADEEGDANQLLEALGSRMQIVPGNVSSIDMEFASTRTIIATVSGNHTLLDGISTLTFNRPSSITGGTPLVTTSVLSWTDTTGSGRPGAGASLGRYTLIAREEVDPGEIILIADASLFATTMQEVRQLHDNRQFLENMLDTNGTVSVDAVYGKTADAEGPAYIIHKVKSAPISTIIAILLLMVFVIVAFRKQIL